MHQNPYEPSADPGSPPRAVASGRAIVVALSQQAFILLLATLVLDGGRFLRLVSGVLAACWIVSLLVLLRCRGGLTGINAAVVKFGFWAPVGVLFWAYFTGLVR